MANHVFKGRHFLQRLGSDWGLTKVGMYHQGIIWNNDRELWAELRTMFNRGMNSLVLVFVFVGKWDGG